MLVLSQHVDDSIVIELPDGRTVVITVVEIRREYKVRLGFEADKDIKILRSELRDRIAVEGSKRA